MNNFCLPNRLGWFAIAWLAVAPQALLAEGRDSNADAAKSELAAVAGSVGVVLRVPVTPMGDEDTNAAEMRVYTGTRGESVSPESLPAVFDRSKVILPIAVAGDSNTSADSSTWGWNRFDGWGVRSPYYYYYNYTPYFNYYGHYYGYGNYYYPTYSFPSYYNLYGYRYYYYGCGW